MSGGEQTIPVDFTQLVDSDNKGDSKYVVGGRVYFEGSVHGSAVHSFTYKGFFDQAGYVEPASALNKIKSSGLIWIIVGSLVALVLIVVLVYAFCCKSSEGKKTKPKSE